MGSSDITARNLLKELVAQTIASWNQITSWLEVMDSLRKAFLGRAA